MTGAAIESLGGGRYRLDGVLDFSTVPVVWPSLEALLRGGTVTLSLQGVAHGNSAALALLLEALAHARSSKTRLTFVDIPEHLLDLARMSDVDRLLSGN